MENYPRDVQWSLCAVSRKHDRFGRRDNSSLVIRQMDYTKRGNTRVHKVSSFIDDNTKGHLCNGIRVVETVAPPADGSSVIGVGEWNFRVGRKSMPK
jgi:hypothetical protein